MTACDEQAVERLSISHRRTNSFRCASACLCQKLRVVVLLGQVNNPKVSRNRGTPSVSVGLRVPHNTGRLLVLHLRLVLVGLGTVSK